MGVSVDYRRDGMRRGRGETIDYAEDEPTEEVEQPFTAKDFNVTIEIPHRGPGPGGWQTAFGHLDFSNVKRGLKCTVRVNFCNVWLDEMRAIFKDEKGPYSKLGARVEKF
jgi:hypothetical protein